jgi:hypothetical protein
MSKVVIKKKGITIEMERSDLVMVDQTADGVVFNFKYGLFLHYTDNFMPNGAKELMKNTSNSFPNAKKLTFNLDNYNKPVSAEM